MKSMTGYGSVEIVSKDYSLNVEISTLNRKQLDIRISLPKDLEPLEPKIRELIGQFIYRGVVQVKIDLQFSDWALAHRLHMNKELAKTYINCLREFASTLGISEQISLSHLLQAPGIFVLQPMIQNLESFWPTLREAITKAINQVIRMRTKEGNFIARDLKKRLSYMKKIIKQIAKRAPQVVEIYRQELKKKLRSLGVDVNEKDESYKKEIILFAERADIMEELTRVRSHFSQFQQLLKSSKPVGKTLDFLAQEIQREINTIGAKANDTQIIHAVVELKAEIDRIREQLQNIE